MGISGAELTRNALLQAQKFGARITLPGTVTRLGTDGGLHVITLDDGSRTIQSHSKLFEVMVEVPSLPLAAPPRDPGRDSR